MRLVALATGPEADRTKVQIPTRGSNAARNRAAMLVRLDMTGLIGFSFGYYAILDRYELLMLETDFPSRQFCPQGAGVRIVQVDIGQRIGRHAPVDLGVIGDVKVTLNILLPLLEAGRETRGFAARTGV